MERFQLMPRLLAQVEMDIRAHCASSASNFASLGFTDLAGDIWVLKFMLPKYLSDFQTSHQLRISSTAGYTWGDGVYVVPLSNPYSTMMYGRVGVMGRIAASGLTYWDARSTNGVHLFQEWIGFQPFLHRELTTTVRTVRAARLLRNRLYRM